MVERREWWRRIKPSDLWYLVGLITSDGSLSKDGRHIDITSKEYDFLDSLKKNLNISASIGRKRNGSGAESYRIQIGSKSFYRFLQEVELTTNKSKVLASLNIPLNNFVPFLRGIIDGDGCIRKWKDCRSGNYKWYLKILSGSEKFLIWLNENINKVLCAHGCIYYEKNRYGGCYQLKVTQGNSIKKILSSCYMNHDIALTRKRMKALEYLRSHC